MPLVVSQNQRIYYEIIGDRGPCLVLHGSTMLTVDSWYKANYVELLQEQYRVVMIEPLGQGRSSAPEEIHYYTLRSRAEHVLAVSYELGIENFHFLGMGLGAQVGFALCADFPKSVRSLITVGGHPYAVTTEMEELKEAIQQLRSGHIAEYLQQYHSDEHISLEQQEGIKRGASTAYALALEAVSAWEGLGERLAGIMTPSLLITNTAEPRFLSIREAGRAMKYSRYLILPKLKYNFGLLDAELVIPPLTEFIQKQRWSP